jgi:hypothetical protein
MQTFPQVKPLFTISAGKKIATGRSRNAGKIPGISLSGGLFAEKNQLLPIPLLPDFQKRCSHKDLYAQ